jgi:hypothetical protein
MTSPSTPPKSYRLQVTEAELAKFTIQHGEPKTNPSGRRLQRLVELTPTRQEIGEKPVVITAENWEKVKALAARNGGSYGTIDLTPMAALSFGRALKAGLEGAMAAELRDAVNAVLRMCMTGRGLRVSTKRV